MPGLGMSVADGLRKKGLGVRPWLLLDSSRQTQDVEAGKHAIMRRTGLPARDLRILDPLLSYPSTVLGRERAIVINLEHIKAIISAHEEKEGNANESNWYEMEEVEADAQVRRAAGGNGEDVVDDGAGVYGDAERDVAGAVLTEFGARRRQGLES
ncbi:hypothetical protein ACFX2G_027686 [Malus domestica]